MRSLAPWPDNPLYAAGYMAFIVVLMIIGLGLRRVAVISCLVLVLSMVLMVVLAADWVVHTVAHAFGGL
jgi:hypothetical protein